MKLSNKIIRIIFDFEYGKNKGLSLIAILFQLSIWLEVLKLNRYWYFILMPLGLIVTYFWGYFLRKINYRKREMDFINGENRMLQNINNKIKQNE